MIQNIQLLRAVAALLVCMHHTKPHYVSIGGQNELLIKFSEYGFIGVDIFFVISGFIMVYSTKKLSSGINSATTFMKKRFLRIFTAYWPVLIVAILASTYFNIPRWEGINILHSIFLTSTDMTKLAIPVSWSLSYELYFYFLFTFLILWKYKISFKIILSIFIGLTLCQVFFYSKGIKPPFFVSPFLCEFFAGCLLGLFYNKIESLPVAVICFLVALSLFYLGADANIRNGIWRVVYYGVASVLLLYSFLIFELKNLKTPKAIKIFGDSSYGLYLIHTIILLFFYWTGARNYIVQHYTFSPELIYLLLLVIMILLSIVYYKVIEKPFYKSSLKIFLN